MRAQGQECRTVGRVVAGRHDVEAPAGQLFGLHEDGPLSGPSGFLELLAEEGADVPEASEGVDRDVAWEPEAVAHLSDGMPEAARHFGQVHACVGVSLFCELSDDGCECGHAGGAEVAVEPLEDGVLGAGSGVFLYGFGERVCVAFLQALEGVSEDAQSEVEPAAPVSEEIPQSVFFASVSCGVTSEGDGAGACDDDDAGFSVGGSPVGDQVVGLNAVDVGSHKGAQKAFKGGTSFFYGVASHSGADGGKARRVCREAGLLAGLRDGVLDGGGESGIIVHGDVAGPSGASSAFGAGGVDDAGCGFCAAAVYAQIVVHSALYFGLDFLDSCTYPCVSPAGLLCRFL